MDVVLPFGATSSDDVELAVVDLGVARAFWEGVPAARLLARMRLERDERDLVALADRASGLELASSTWDTLMARLLARAPASFDRVKRAVARHGRAASDEGPVAAGDAAIAALVRALLSVSEADVDASPAETSVAPAVVDDAVAAACARIDLRLASSEVDPRAAPFEACVIAATLGRSAPLPIEALRSLGTPAISAAPLYPWGEREVPERDRRALLLDRAVVERNVASGEAHPRIRAEASRLFQHHGVLVALVVSGADASSSATPESTRDRQSIPPSSWLPSDLGSPDAAARLAAALERGATTAARARSLILRGGDAALDAIGAEMLQATAHPFASAVFADILGRASRERDVVRLVSYFAIAPDPAAAAHALAVCTAPEVSSILRAWLESAQPPQDALDALARYPHLGAVAKTLRR